MFCSKCGKQIENPNVQFCPYCGNPMNLQSPVKEKPVGLSKTDKTMAQKRTARTIKKRWRIGLMLLPLILAVLALSSFLAFKYLKGGQTVTLQNPEDDWQPLAEIEQDDSADSEEEEAETDLSESTEEQSVEEAVADKAASEEEDSSGIHSYSVEKVNCTWTEAKAIAEEKGGHLAIINSEEENEYIKSLLQLEGVIMYWIGGTDLEGGIYTWIDGTPIQYADWHDGEPNGDQGIEHYMSLYQIGGEWKWNDLPDDVGAYYGDSLGLIIEYEDAE